MNIIERLINLLTEMDQHLLALAYEFGTWTYVILFLIVFLESTVTPLLPGDSLLFAAGALATSALLNVHMLVALFTVATVLGTLFSYEIGRWLGPAIFKESRRWFNPERLNKTRAFYHVHGRRTILIARFVPVIRTLAPVVAGVATMSYFHFILYNFIGGMAWVALFTYGGFFFGAMPIVKDNFAVVVLVVFLVSLTPFVMERVWSRHRRASASA
jgi:membrane-associated protein